MHKKSFSLNTKAWFGVFFFAIATGVLLFLTAGSFQYWQAWGYLAVVVSASIIITLYLIRKDPALLKRRLRAGPTAEKRKSEKIIMFFTSVGFIALLVVPALDYRFKWSNMPFYLVIAGDVFTAVGFFIIFSVYKENTFSSATIEISENQKVIATGPYAIVRHPMYAGGFVYLVAMPFALGSFRGIAPLAVTIPFLIWRLYDEELFLSKNLPGYTDYCAIVRWRLIPGVF
jgi:protein-S-isoprenylcysteine O-methyltransferase Ste14